MFVGICLNASVVIFYSAVAAAIAGMAVPTVASSLAFLHLAGHTRVFFRICLNASAVIYYYAVAAAVAALAVATFLYQTYVLSHICLCCGTN